MIEELIENPSEENKQKYLDFVNQKEYDLILEAHKFPPKSQEFFDKKREAFTFKRESAKILLNQWVAVYGTTENCPVSYADTLIIPFQKIQIPKEKK
jgi:hypothetical protein